MIQNARNPTECKLPVIQTLNSILKIQSARAFGIVYAPLHKKVKKHK